MRLLALSQKRHSISTDLAVGYEDIIIYTRCNKTHLDMYTSTCTMPPQSYIEKHDNTHSLYIMRTNTYSPCTKVNRSSAIETAGAARVYSYTYVYTLYKASFSSVAHNKVPFLEA